MVCDTYRLRTSHDDHLSPDVGYLRLKSYAHHAVWVLVSGNVCLILELPQHGAQALDKLDLVHHLPRLRHNEEVSQASCSSMCMTCVQVVVRH